MANTLLEDDLETSEGISSNDIDQGLPEYYIYSAWMIFRDN